MADIAVSGTLTAAVLETAGYMSQEYILTSFHDFLKGTGVLLFMIAAVGAVVSVAVFGSYKNAKYFIIGPTLFAFLIGPMDTIEGAVGKLGGGKCQLEHGKTDDCEKAAEETRALAQSSRIAASDEAVNKPINIAFPFKIFTRAVGGIVNALSDLILAHENDQDLLFLAKTEAFDTLLRLNVENADLLSMLQGDLMLECNTMMNAALMLASPHFSDRRMKELTTQLSRPEITANSDVQSYYQNALNNIKNMRDATKLHSYAWDYEQGKKAVFNPSPALRKYLATSSGKPAPATVTCGDAETAIKTVMLDHAREHYKELIKKYDLALDPDTGMDEGKLCFALAKKVGISMDSNESSAQCQDALVEIMAMFLIRNAVTNSNSSQVITTMKNRMNLITSIPNGQVETLDGPLGDCTLIGGQDSYSFSMNKLGGEDATRSQLLAKFDCKGKGVVERPIVTMDGVAGHMEAALSIHQYWQMIELRQQIFTTMTNFPYYQGVILFLLGALYPFATLIVLIPGRAGAFLNFLLAWIWVKSWDVGFAVVMVLDKILWNMLPNPQLDVALDKGEKISTSGLPTLFAQSFNVDPTFHLHAYYFFVSMALAAVPVVTGYATMKFRGNAIKSMAQPFIKSLQSAGEDAADRAGNAYGQNRTNDFVRQLRDIQGMNPLSMSSRALSPGQAQGGGSIFEQEGRGDASSFWAANQAVASTVKGFASATKDGKSAAKAALSGLAGFQPAYVSAQNKMMGAMMDRDLAEKRVYDDRFGLMGRYHTGTNMMIAAVDGGGGYELNDMTSAMSEAVSAEQKLYMTQLKAKGAIIADYLTAALLVMNNGSEKVDEKKVFSTIQGLVASVPGLFEVGMGLAKNGVIPTDGHLSYGEAEKRFAEGIRNAGINPNEVMNTVLDTFREVMKGVAEIKNEKGRPLTDEDLQSYDPKLQSVPGVTLADVPRQMLDRNGRSTSDRAGMVKQDPKPN